MKSQLLFLLPALILWSVLTMGQTDTIWYDANWKQTDKIDAAYYRTVAVKNGEGFWVVDYYVSGIKQMEGLTMELDSEVYQGKVTWFYDNGAIFQVVHYDHGLLNGPREVYHENGQVKSKTGYVDGKIHGEWVEYYENGVQKEVGSYQQGEKNGPWKTYYPNGQLKEEGRYVLDRKVEVWKTYFYDGSEQKS